MNLRAVLIPLVVVLGLPPVSSSRAQVGAPPQPALSQPAVPQPAPLGLLGGERRAAPANQPPILKVEPDTWLLPDAEGQLRPVLGFTYEEFRAAWQILQNLQEAVPGPRYSINRYVVAGQQSTPDFFKASVDIDVEFLDKGPVEVPLGLGAVVVRGESYEDEADLKPVIRFDHKSRQWVAWANPLSPCAVRIRLEVLISIDGDDTQRRVEVLLPRALTGEVNFRIAGNPVEATTDDHNILTRESDEEGTWLRISSNGGLVSVVWKYPRNRVGPAAGAMQARTDLLATLDGQSVIIEARMVIDSFGKPLKSFRLRLPSEVTLRATEEARYVSRNVLQDSAVGLNVYEFVLRQPQIEPFNLTVVAEAPFDDQQQQVPFELSGFEVEGAVRQFGHVGIQVRGDRQVTWESNAAVSQVTDGPEWMRSEHLIALFEHYRRDWNLKITAIRRRATLVVETTHEVFVADRYVEWVGRMQCAMRGGKTLLVRLKLGEWELQPDGVQPLTAVDGENVVVGTNNVVNIPLREQTDGVFALTVKARRPWPLEVDEIDLQLPVPIGAEFVPGRMQVSSEPHIEVQPQLDQFVGLSSRPVGTLELPDVSRRAMVFRSESEAARFVARREFHEFEFMAQIAATAVLNSPSVRVTETITYTAQHGTVEQLDLLIPAAAIDNSSLVILVDGEQVTPTLGSSAGVDSSNRLVPVSIALGAPTTGALIARVEYSLPEPKSEQDRFEYELPLAVPTNATVGRTTVSIQALPRVQLNLALAEGPGGWSSDSASGPTPLGSGAFLTCYATGRPQPVLLELTRLASVAERKAVIRRAWLQSWLIGDRVRETAWYAVRSREPFIRFELPPQATMDSLHITIDDTPVTSFATDHQMVSLAWPQSFENREQRLRIVYYRPAATGIARPLSLRMLQMPQATPQYEWKWQVITPADEHLVRTSELLVREYQWQLVGISFKRLAAMSQNEVAAWIGLEPTAALPPGSHAYLFSGFGKANGADVMLAKRSVLVLIASGVVLIGSLLLMYLPRLRKLPVLLVVAIFVTAVGLVEKELAPLFLQAAVVGVTLVVIAMLLRRVPWCSVPRAERDSELGVESSISTSLAVPARSGGSSQQLTMPSTAAAITVSVPESQQ